jgi:agmatinase
MAVTRKFFDQLSTEEEADVIAFGAQIGRKAKEGIQRLRDTSWYVWTYDLDRRKDIAPISLADVGNIEVKNYADMEKISAKVEEIISRGKISLVLGGGHITTLYTFKPFVKLNTKLVIFDCHCDAQDEFIDDKMIELSYLEKDKITAKMNDTTWLRRLCELPGMNPKNILLLGIRSGAKSEQEFLDSSGITYFTANQIKDNPDYVAKAVKRFVGKSEVYVNVDIDAFDPAYAPAVDQPEPNGLDFREFSQLVNAIEGKLVGLDLVCFRPMAGNEVTEFLGVRVIYEIFGLISKEEQRR